MKKHKIGEKEWFLLKTEEDLKEFFTFFALDVIKYFDSFEKPKKLPVLASYYLGDYDDCETVSYLYREDLLYLAYELNSRRNSS